MRADFLICDFLICDGGGVRTIGSAEPSPGCLCSPVTSSFISVSLSGVYGWCQHKRQNKSKVCTVSSLFLFLLSSSSPCFFSTSSAVLAP